MCVHVCVCTLYVFYSALVCISKIGPSQSTLAYTRATCIYIHRSMLYDRMRLYISDFRYLFSRMCVSLSVAVYIYGTLLAGTQGANHQVAQMSWLLNFLLLCIPQRLLVHFLDQYRFDQNHPMDSKDHFDGDSSPRKSKDNLMWNWPNPPGTSLDTSYLSPGNNGYNRVSIHRN